MIPTEVCLAICRIYDEHVSSHRELSTVSEHVRTGIAMAIMGMCSIDKSCPCKAINEIVEEMREISTDLNDINKLAINPREES